MAWIIKPDGQVATEIDPKQITLAKAQEIVGGYVERIKLLDGSVMLVNEEGKMHSLPPNWAATAMYARGTAVSDLVVGTVLHIPKDQLKGAGWGR